MKSRQALIERNILRTLDGARAEEIARERKQLDRWIRESESDEKRLRRIERNNPGNLTPTERSPERAIGLTVRALTRDLRAEDSPEARTLYAEGRVRGALKRLEERGAVSHSTGWGSRSTTWYHADEENRAKNSAEAKRIADMYRRVGVPEGDMLSAAHMLYADVDDLAAELRRRIGRTRIDRDEPALARMRQTLVRIADEIDSARDGEFTLKSKRPTADKND